MVRRGGPEDRAAAPEATGRGERLRPNQFSAPMGTHPHPVAAAVHRNPSAGRAGAVIWADDPGSDPAPPLPRARHGRPCGGSGRARGQRRPHGGGCGGGACGGRSRALLPRRRTARWGRWACLCGLLRDRAFGAARSCAHAPAARARRAAAAGLEPTAGEPPPAPRGSPAETSSRRLSRPAPRRSCPTSASCGTSGMRDDLPAPAPPSCGSAPLSARACH